MQKPEINDTIIKKHLPQPHAQAEVDRIAAGKMLRQSTLRKIQATWTIAYLGRQTKKVQESIKREPLIPTDASLDYMLGKAGTDG